MKTPNSSIGRNFEENFSLFQGIRRSDVAMKIRRKMIEKGFKNVDLAKRIGVSEANVSRWLRGDQNLSIDTIYRLADALEEPFNISIGSKATTDTLAADEDCDLTNVVEMNAYRKMQPLTNSSGNDFTAAKSELGFAEPPYEQMVN